MKYSHILENISTFKNIIKFGLSGGFIFGFTLGLVPNKIQLKVNDVKYSNVPTPLVGGVIGMGVFAFSPFIVTNWLFNGTYMDKLFDKYYYNIKRYHQYDGNDNKYAYPSSLHIEINSVKKK